MLHDHGTRVASAIKGLVVGIDRLVHPCDITVSLDLLEIEICTEESCQRLISFPDLIIFTLMRMGKEEVYLPEHVPVPCTGCSRHNPGSLHLVRERLRDHIVIILLIEVACCRQYRIEIICEQLALCLCPEICVRAELILRFSDKEILTGSHRKQYDRKHYMAEFHSNVLFHISLSS